MTIKAVIFDIGGVVLGSPIVGVGEAEKLFDLPHHYINAHITYLGEEGAFQRLERGELALPEFEKRFGEEMSNVETGNKAYRLYCRKMNLDVPELPTKLNIDGSQLWSLMMGPALEPDPIMLDAINALRASKKFKLAALTNNFAVPGEAPTPSKIDTLPHDRLLTHDELRQSILDAAVNPSKKGSSSSLLKRQFDVFVESAVEGSRKPNPKFYQIALDRLGSKAEEAVFLDDIGRNLVAAKKMGIHTIRVHPSRSIEAVRELEKLVGIPLQGKAQAKL
ncbi:hypothetical protein MVLG_04537 [Microbotryum lychnidis-dioicae p1A1 Lamole]|uniref:Uncharacterized protein n=1 Tax=Microbotryum lychnidis-dioicae (strain p1A1 Lamole / MvSl-1064) TaxID=683840 RepID=U5HBI7_USTV1|nr:hypothetical protein MVLG_04537 [Microbotryum lychnidis-dioicae p1A1 Lamole]|eukprot:KDE05097.1 hypothetical protein MVLG_04537 [Microbotryum lychnidis-dioicae p1A1 Lamole]